MFAIRFGRRTNVLLALCVTLAVAVGLPPARAEAAEATTSIAEEPIDLGADAGDIDHGAARGLTTLYRFPAGTRGRFPRGGVVVDGSGNIYGTTLYEGACSTCGIIYMLRKPTGGSTVWTQSIVHQFSFPNGTNFQDGRAPTAPLTLYGGSIYGTTSAGADPLCGCGEVFKITPNAAATSWTYTVLHRFRRNIPAPPVGGSTPVGGLLIDASGIYGTTSSGGQSNGIGAGVIFKLTHGGAFSILHRFSGDPNGGPQGELAFGKSGAIYGTQFGGGNFDEGVVFRITKAGAYKVLYNFKGVNQIGGSTDGAQPEGRLAIAPNGTIYGTTSFGGTPSGYGTAWSLTPNAAGTVWTYKQLRRFGQTGDANIPHSGFVRRSNGVLYGTGAGGGQFQEGAIYSLTPPATASGPWTYRTLHSFNGPVTPSNGHGHIPYGVIVLKGTVLYGQNVSGGHVTVGGVCNRGCGTVFMFGL